MSNQEKISQKFYEALMSKYASEMNEAEATLLVYFNNPVGIGEHPQHLEEMDKMVEKLAKIKAKHYNNFINTTNYGIKEKRIFVRCNQRQVLNQN
jgi:hypothetical protein